MAVEEIEGTNKSSCCRGQSAKRFGRIFSRRSISSSPHHETTSENTEASRNSFYPAMCSQRALFDCPLTLYGLRGCGGWSDAARDHARYSSNNCTIFSNHITEIGNEDCDNNSARAGLHPSDGAYNSHTTFDSFTVVCDMWHNTVPDVVGSICIGVHVISGSRR